MAVADGPGAPWTTPWEACVDPAASEPVSLLVGWMVEPSPWLDKLSTRPAGSVSSVHAGRELTAAINAGRVRYVPVRLSAVPRLLSGRFRPDVAVVSGRPVAGGYVFGAAVGWAYAAARCARSVVVELNPEAPPYDAPTIPGHVVSVVESPRPPALARLRPPDPAELVIAELVASLVPARATIQYGPGSGAEAIIDALQVPVHVHSGSVNDALVRLACRGLLAGRAEAAYAWGTASLAQLSSSGDLRLLPVEATHSAGRLAATPRFVAINTALEVGLDGSVNIERIGGRLVSGIGGHSDFCGGAARSDGGLSIIAVAATRHGASTIVPRPEVVSTPRSDIDIVVTEHGIADLRGLDDEGRRSRLLAVAAPQFRDGLAAV